MSRRKNNIFDEMFLSEPELEDDIIPIMTDIDEINPDDSELPDILPILPLRNTVLFPGIVIPISLGRKKSLKLIKSVFKGNKYVGIISQILPEIENPKFKDIYRKGTIARVVKVFDMPDGSKTAIIQGLNRFEITEEISQKVYLKVKYKLLKEKKIAKSNKEFQAIGASVKEMATRVVELSPNIPQEASFAVKNIDNNNFLINFVASNSDFSSEEKQLLIETDSIKARGELLIKYLDEEIQKLELKDNIQSKAKTEMDQQQREYFLNQQMKAIQDELGVDNHSREIDALEKKGKKKKWSKKVKKVFKKQIQKLRMINPMSPDFSMQMTYLQTLIELPWNKYTKDNFDIKNAKTILDEDHFGLDKVKDRILEHLAVLKLKGDLKAPILCLYGPPGVGKTSLGKSVARALNRKYARMSLGGLHDESEIRGHRKTYIGAMPGRLIQNLKKAKASNPVFILDEIDKIGNDFRGDPSSALLEVLDPEQNSTFYDNYLELEYDLSKILFIATANSLGSIKPALRDRMELIDVSGYIVEEKIQIAKRHLVPKQLSEHGVSAEQVKFSEDAIEEIITNYTRESGVRALDKRIAEVIRKIAYKIAIEEKFNKNLTEKEVQEHLGTPKFQKEKYEGNNFAGVVTGLAWTSVGGTILYIEASLSKGNGKLTLTGNLGDVMKESAIIALEYLKANAEKWDIDNEIFNNYNIHIHVPEGATPKDGPSAGVTMITALASVYTQRKVRSHLAMTGEIALRGKVMPVGGIKEKILAAKRADIKEIILCKENKKDIEEIKEIYLKGLKFHYVDTISEVLELALLKEKVPNFKKLEVKKDKK